LALFSKPPRQSPLPRTFDGVVGRDELAALVGRFMDAAVEGWIEPQGSIAQQILSATPGDPKAPVGQDFLVAPWKWILAVCTRAENDGNNVLAGQIGLMTEIWNRRILAEDSRYQFGRLVKVPPEIEWRIYSSALRSLTRAAPSDVVVPGGDRGWTASEAVNQLTATIEDAARMGEAVDLALLGLARGGARFAVEVPPAPTTNSLDVQAFSEAIDDDIARAQAGDSAADAWLRASYLQLNDGDPHEVLALHERAAQGGHTTAMYDAGCVASRLGDQAKAEFWWSAAAAAGNANASWNLALAHANTGRLVEAIPYFERTAELGDVRAYGELVKVANALGDDQAQVGWERLGAAAGEPFCMFRYGLRLTVNANDDVESLLQARDLLERAADLGSIDAMGMAANVNSMLGDQSRARRFIDMVVATGDQEATDRLRRHGFI